MSDERAPPLVADWRPSDLQSTFLLSGRLGWQGLKADEYRLDGPHVVSSAHFKNERVVWDLCPRVSLRRYSLDRNIQLRVGDVLLMKDGAAMGKLAYIDWLPGPACLNSHLLVFRPRNETHDPKFLFYILDHSDFRAYARVHGTGVTFAGLSQALTGDYVVNFPPQQEQRRIAEILDTLDEAIRKTAQVIAKLKQMKQGLLHDLLTCGVDENGALRDPKRHPEQFKDSPLGLRPKGWTVCHLGEVMRRADYGISSSLAAHGATPILRMMNFSDGEADLTDLKYSDLQLPKHLLLRPGDVLFNRTNSLAHVGRTGIWRGQIERASFASYLVRLVPDEDQLASEFLNRWLNWSDTQVRIRRWATPSISQVNINPTSLKRTTIALPGDTTEQTTIVSLLSSHDAHIATEEAQLQKLQTLKHGLMDDLLTGRVRVPLTSEST